MPSLLQLPQSIWRDNVVNYLEKVEDLARLDSAVANKSDRATFHTNISGCKRFIEYNDSSKDGKLQWFAVRNLVVKVMFLKEEPTMEDRPYIQQLLLNVTWINFAKVAFAQNSDLLHWACSATLKALYLKNCNVVDISGISACSHLVDLTIFDCPHLTDASFVTGIGGCVKLKYCNVHNCTNLGAAAIVALLASCAYLNNVRLFGYFDLQQVFTLFRSESNVKKFTCSDHSGTLCLKGAAIQAMASALPQLTYIDLDYQHSMVTDADIEVLAHGCKCLTFIKLLHRMPHLTNTGVMSIARGLAQLDTLYLSHLSVTDAAVQAVGSYCKVLRSLNINDCALITDAAFCTFHMTCLSSLCVNGTRITGTFASYVLSPQSALDSFYCFVGEQLNAEFVHSLTRNTTVTTLGLGKNLLTEADWLELSMKFPNLSELYLRNAAVVNDVIALSFYKHCPELRAFVITDCNVSPEVMEQVKTK